VHIARLQVEILKNLEKKMQQRVSSFETQTKYTKTWSAPVNSQTSHSITSLHQNHPIPSVSTSATADSKGNTSTSISRKEVRDRIAN